MAQSGCRITRSISGQIDKAIERGCATPHVFINLQKGTLLSIAFSNEYLKPAVAGEITHENWCKNVYLELSRTYGDSIAQELEFAWKNEEYTIDHQLLSNIKKLRSGPDCKLVLVTNATTKLSVDLLDSRLDLEFDVVVNSSEIGIAKPDIGFYKKALSLSECTPEQVVYIDDSLLNVDAAKALGIASVYHLAVSDTIKFVVDKCT